MQGFKLAQICNLKQYIPSLITGIAVKPQSVQDSSWEGLAVQKVETRKKKNVLDRLYFLYSES